MKVCNLTLKICFGGFLLYVELIAMRMSVLVQIWLLTDKQQDVREKNESSNALT